MSGEWSAGAFGDIDYRWCIAGEMNEDSIEDRSEERKGKWSEAKRWMAYEGGWVRVEISERCDDNNARTCFALLTSSSNAS